MWPFGPSIIVMRINPVTVRLQLSQSRRIHPTFHISRFKLVLSIRLALANRPPVPPQLVSSQPAYVVQIILNHYHVRHDMLYLVNWEGNGFEEDTWVPA